MIIYIHCSLLIINYSNLPISLISFKVSKNITYLQDLIKTTN